MDALERDIAAGLWAEATTRAASISGSASSYVAQRRWLEEPAEAWTLDLVASTLACIRDSSWALQAVLAKGLDRPGLIGAALDALLARDTLGLDDELLQDARDLRERVQSYESLFPPAHTAVASDPQADVDGWGIDEDEAHEPAADVPQLAAIPLTEFVELGWPEIARLLASESQVDRLSTVLRSSGSAVSPSDRRAALDCLPLHVPPEAYAPLIPRDSRDWLIDRVRRIDAEAGLLDVALSLVEHGASMGIPELETLAEDLSFLCKLVYEARAPGVWSLERWRQAIVTPEVIVKAYMSQSTAQTVVGGVRTLLVPFLFLVEARSERAGRPDPTLATRMLHHYALHDAPLDQFAAMVEASKPTLPLSRRLIRDNADLARLALARLYSETATTSDTIARLSSVFECMPAFDGVQADTGPVSPLAALLPPADAKTSADALFAILATLGPAQLSLALDALDVHLEAAETLARWTQPTPLFWLLRACEDASAQRVKATRLARRATTGSDDFESDDEWEALMEDMVRLTQPSSTGVRGALGLLDRTEVMRQFFGGLLSSGKFALARSLFNPSSGVRPLEPGEEEKLVIAASREYYENADSGNLHKGGMKLAYDCLGAAPQTPEIRRERDFIEATSRLTSYRLSSTSQPGEPLSPLEIRSAKDKLALIRALLSAPNSPHGQPDLVLELLHKLDGRAGDKLRDVRALSLVVEAGCAADEPLKAAEVIDRIVQAVDAMRKAASKSSQAASDADAAADVAWRACRMVGSHPTMRSDPDRQMALLGRALLLCPEDQIASILPTWRNAERSLSKLDAIDDPLCWARPPASAASTSGSTFETLGKAATAYFRQQPSPAPPRSATPTSQRATSPPPAAGAQPPQRSIHDLFGGDRDDAATAAASRAAAAAKARAQAGFSRGVGWLLGVEDDDA